jgi:hypothetical protein
MNSLKTVHMLFLACLLIGGLQSTRAAAQKNPNPAELSSLQAGQRNFETGWPVAEEPDDSGWPTDDTGWPIKPLDTGWGDLSPANPHP